MEKAVKSIFGFAYLLIPLISCTQSNPISHLNEPPAKKTYAIISYFQNLDSIISSSKVSHKDSISILQVFETYILVDDSISLMSATSMEISDWIFNFSVSNNYFLNNIDSFQNIARSNTYYLGYEISNLVENNALEFLNEKAPIMKKFAYIYLESNVILQDEIYFTREWLALLNSN